MTLYNYVFTIWQRDLSSGIWRNRLKGKTNELRSLGQTDRLRGMTDNFPTPSNSFLPANLPSQKRKRIEMEFVKKTPNLKLISQFPSPLCRFCMRTAFQLLLPPS